MTPHYDPFRVRRAPAHKLPVKLMPEPVQDDAALYGKRQADLARNHLAPDGP